MTAVLGEGSASKIRSITLSNNSISRRIVDMTTDVKEQLINMIKTGQKFALQLDESTDIADCAVLMVCVRFVNTTASVLQEEFLVSEEIPARITGDEIFRCLNNFITGCDLDWNNCVGITSDGAAAMTGKRAGVVQRVKNVAPSAAAYHCFIHREALAAKE